MGKPIMPLMVLIMIGFVMWALVDNYNGWLIKNPNQGQGFNKIDCPKNEQTMTGGVSIVSFITAFFGNLIFGDTGQSATYSETPQCTGAGVPWWYWAFVGIPFIVAFIYALIPFVG